MIWRVDSYTDRLREVANRDDEGMWSRHIADGLMQPRALYFDTRDEAVAFMVRRAENNVRAAEAELRKARARAARVRRKYAAATESEDR